MISEEVRLRLDDLERRVSHLESRVELIGLVSPRSEHADRALVQEAFTEYAVEILTVLEQLHWSAKCNCHMGHSTKEPGELHHAECPVGKAQKLLDAVWEKKTA